MIAAPDFAECASCAAKPGSPILCPACLHNRATINQLRAERDRDRAKRRLLGRGAALPGRAMTEIQRKEVLARVKKIAHDARHLAAYDGVTSPPDWRPFVAELADEVAKILSPPRRQRSARRRRSAR